MERRLFETTTAVRLSAFDADAFADEMERASRGSDSVISLVQGTLNLLAGLAGIIAVAVGLAVIHPLLLIALLLATVPNVWATLMAGHQRYRTYIAGSVRRRRLWVLHRLMAERDSAPELRSYGLRGFLLGQYDKVMGTETRIQLDLARRVTTTTSVGAMVGGVAVASTCATTPRSWSGPRRRCRPPVATPTRVSWGSWRYARCRSPIPSGTGTPWKT